MYHNSQGIAGYQHLGMALRSSLGYQWEKTLTYGHSGNARDKFHYSWVSASCLTPHQQEGPKGTSCSEAWTNRGDKTKVSHEAYALHCPSMKCSALALSHGHLTCSLHHHSNKHLAELGAYEHRQ